MHVGIIQDSICKDVAVFKNLSDAQALMDDGMWPWASQVAELKDGFGIGDRFLDGLWESDREISGQEEDS